MKLGKQKTGVILVSMLFLVVFGVMYNYSVLAPQTDVTIYIHRVTVGSSTFIVDKATFSKSFPKGIPDISIALNIQKSKSLGEDTLAFHSEQYKLYKWAIPASIRIQANSKEPWFVQDNILGGHFEFGGVATVKVEVGIKARTEWRFMWAIVSNITEKTGFNQDPTDSMTTGIHYGDAKALEPNSVNAYVTASSPYATQWDQYWNQNDLSKTPVYLYFSAKLDAPSWVKDNWLAPDDKGTGYAFVQWEFKIYIGYVVKIDPNTGDADEPLKDPTRDYAVNQGEIPWWATHLLIGIIAVIVVAAAYMIGPIGGLRKIGKSKA